MCVLSGCLVDRLAKLDQANFINQEWQERHKGVLKMNV